MDHDKGKKLEVNRKTKIVISPRDADKVMAHLEMVASRTTYTRDKEAKKYREMTQTLHNFLQKLKAHADGN